MDNLYKVLTAGGSIPPNNIKVTKEKTKMSKLGKESPLSICYVTNQEGASYSNISTKIDELGLIDLE